MERAECGQLVVHRVSDEYLHVVEGPVDEVTAGLGCEWQTVTKEVARRGKALLEADTDRVGQAQAVGVDETLFRRKGQWRVGDPATRLQRSEPWCRHL